MKTLKRDDGIVNDLDEDVKSLQELLNKIGYNLAADGKFGLKTENAIKDFQTKNLILPPTGIADSITIQKIIEKKEKKNLTNGLEIDYNEYKKYESILKSVVQNLKYVDLPLSFGLGSRESNWGRTLVNNWGDHGNAAGIFQVDKRWHKPHIDSGDCNDFTKHSTYALNLLESNIKYFLKKYPLDSKDVNVSRGICAYNAGCGGVDNKLKQGMSADSATTGGNYGTDVLSRTGWFKTNHS